MENTFLKYILNDKARYIKGLILLLFVNICQVLTPKITGYIIDHLKGKTLDKASLLFFIEMIMIVALVSFVLNFLSRIQLIGGANKIEYCMRNELFDTLLTQEADFFVKKSVGEIMALAVNDISAVRMAMGRGVILIFDTLFLILSSVLLLGKTVDLRLTLYTFAPLPILFVIMIFFGKKIAKIFKAVQKSFADLSGKAQENISGIRIIKAFNKEKEEIENFKNLNNKNYNINMKMVRLWGLFFPTINAFASLSYLIMLYFGGKMVLENKITIGDFVAFNFYIGIIVRPMGFIGMIINFIERARASLQRIQELLDKKLDEEKGKIYDVNIEGNIKINNLTFSYNNTPVLKNINIEINKGKTVAIIGRVGSGKSTLISLLSGLYKPQSKGEILIDGVDILDISIKRLRESIGFVPQDNFLFGTSIYNNINFSSEGLTTDAVENAAKISKIYDDIENMKDKFDSILGERGVNLSGGQKQRISIARAIAKSPKILLLDDCLSAVDTNTERKILKDLTKYMKGKTSIITSHRISTIKNADEIIVLDKGEIIERGTHSELILKKGYYYKIYENQQLIEEEGEAGAI